MKYKFLCCFILLVIGLSPMTLAYSTSYSWSVLDSSIETSAQSSADVQNDNFLNLDAESAILIEQNSGQILYSHNIHEKLHPASVTKIMSLLLIMEALDSGKITLETQIPCSENAANMGGSQIWLDPRENLSVNDMLKAIAVVSANDCVTAIAEYLGGSTENFVKMMNEKAKELGMNDTNFVNCHGLDEDDHLTSAYDIALMSRELLTKHPQTTNYTTIWTDSLRDAVFGDVFAGEPPLGREVRSVSRIEERIVARVREEGLKRKRDDGEDAREEREDDEDDGDDVLAVFSERDLGDLAGLAGDGGVVLAAP